MSFFTMISCFSVFQGFPPTPFPRRRKSPLKTAKPHLLMFSRPEHPSDIPVRLVPKTLSSFTLRRWSARGTGSDSIKWAGLIKQTVASTETTDDDNWDTIAVDGMGEAIEQEITATYGRGPHRGFWNGLRSCARIIMHSVRWIPLAIGWLVVRFIVPGLRSCWYQWLLATLKASGPCFVKLGQWISTRPDIFPAELCSILAELHRFAPTHPWSATQDAIARALSSSDHDIDCSNGSRTDVDDDRKGWSDLFSEFECQPIASGAIAQVYKARLVTGESVAVKVRHPEIAETIALDLSILHVIANVSDRIPIFRPLSLPVAVSEFSRIMLNQVDLRCEVINLIKFRKNFASWRHLINFPRPLALSSEEVLIETFCEGKSIHNYLGSAHQGTKAFRKQVAYLGMVAFLKMLIDDNFIHADLHPGNIIVVEHTKSKRFWQRASSGNNSNSSANNIEPSLSVLDVGLVATLTPTDRENFLALLQSVLNGEGQQGARLMIERSPSAILLTPEETQSFIEEIDELLTATICNPLKEIPIAETLFRMFSIANKYHVVLEANFVTLMTGIMTIEGLARQLDAEFNLRDEAKAWFLRSSESSLWERAKIIHGIMSKVGENTSDTE